MSQHLVWVRGAFPRVSPLCLLSHKPILFIETMVANINNFGVINFYENNASKQESTKKAEPVCEDITPIQEEKVIDSIIFTKKAKKEGKIDLIIQALRKSMQDRRDKSRALVQEVQIWQKDEYIDAHYNARVMYDELAKLIPLSFGYEVFKKYYNNTI